VSGVTLVAQMTPDGAVTHVIEASSNGSTWTNVRTITRTMANGGAYGVDFPGAGVTTRFLRVRTTSTPSWVAWKEIVPYQCP
jgi:hypothetical protein